MSEDPVVLGPDTIHVWALAHESDADITASLKSLFSFGLAAKNEDDHVAMFRSTRVYGDYNKVNEGLSMTYVYGMLPKQMNYILKVIMPMVVGTNTKVRTTVVEFVPSLPTATAPLTTPNELQTIEHVRESGTIKFGHKFSVETDVALHPDGLKDIVRKLTQMAAGFLDLASRICVARLFASDMEKRSKLPRVADLNTYVQQALAVRDQTFAFNKDLVGIPTTIAKEKELMWGLVGTYPDHMIIPSEKMALILNNKLMTIDSNAGPDGHQRLIEGQPIRSMHGVKFADIPKFPGQNHRDTQCERLIRIGNYNVLYRFPGMKRNSEPIWYYYNGVTDRDDPLRGTDLLSKVPFYRELSSNDLNSQTYFLDAFYQSVGYGRNGESPVAPNGATPSDVMRMVYTLNYQVYQKGVWNQATRNALMGTTGYILNRGQEAEDGRVAAGYRATLADLAERNQSLVTDEAPVHRGVAIAGAAAVAEQYEDLVADYIALLNAAQADAFVDPLKYSRFAEGAFVPRDPADILDDNNLASTDPLRLAAVAAREPVFKFNERTNVVEAFLRSNGYNDGSRPVSTQVTPLGEKLRSTLGVEDGDAYVIAFVRFMGECCKRMIRIIDAANAGRAQNDRYLYDNYFVDISVKQDLVNRQGYGPRAVYILGSFVSQFVDVFQVWVRHEPVFGSLHQPIPHDIGTDRVVRFILSSFHSERFNEKIYVADYAQAIQALNGKRITSNSFHTEWRAAVGPNPGRHVPRESVGMFTSESYLRSGWRYLTLRPAETHIATSVIMVKGGRDLGFCMSGPPQFKNGEDTEVARTVFTNFQRLGAHVADNRLLHVVQDVTYHRQIGGCNTTPFTYDQAIAFARKRFVLESSNAPCMYVIPVRKTREAPFIHITGFPHSKELREKYGTEPDYDFANVWATLYEFDLLQGTELDHDAHLRKSGLARLAYMCRMGYMLESGQLHWTKSQTHHGPNGEQPGCLEVRNNGSRVLPHLVAGLCG